MTTEAPVADPSPVLDLLEAFRRSKVMFAGLSLGVFDRLAKAPETLPILAADLHADADALGRLLNGCVALPLLTRQGDRYANSPSATVYLTSDSPRRLT